MNDLCNTRSSAMSGVARSPSPGDAGRDQVPGAPRLRAPPNRADLGDDLRGHGDGATGSTDADGIGWPADKRAAPSLTGGAGDRDRRVAGRRWPPAR